MKSALGSSLAIAALALVNSQAQLTTNTDVGANYAGGWTNGANGGTGFLAWNISNDPGTGGFAGNFIGDPATAGITGMSTESFGLFANPNGSGAFVNADRSFAAPLSVGDVFSFQWGVNWDADGGSKGFNLYSGGTNGNQLLNINQGGFPGDITFDGSNTGIANGNGPMTWTFSLTTPSNLLVTSSARNGTTTPVFTTNISVVGSPDTFRFYAANMGAGSEREPYFNNLTTVVPEPSTYALLTLAALALGGYAARRRARK